MARVSSKITPAPGRDDRIIGSRRVSEEYLIAQRTVFQWAAEGKITVWKLGSKNVYSRSQIESLIQPQRRAS